MPSHESSGSGRPRNGGSGIRSEKADDVNDNEESEPLSEDKKYDDIEEVRVLRDYRKPDEMDETGMYEQKQELHQCSGEEGNKALAVEVADHTDKDKDKELEFEDDGGKEMDQDDDDAPEEKMSKYPRIVRRWPRGVLRPREGDSEMANVMENVEVEESDEDSQRTLIPGPP